MKDSNFDSIKEKFDNSGVNAPDAINEELLLEKLDAASPLEMLPPQKSKKRVAAGVSAAAAVALVTAGAFTFTNVFGNQPQPQTKELVAYHESAGLRGFKNVDELKAAMRDVLTAQKNNSRYGDNAFSDYLEYGMAFSADSVKSSLSSAGSAAGASGSSTHNSTYVQHTGVDEADVVKTDGAFIYMLSLSEGNIVIFSADGENSKRVGEIVLNKEAKSDWFDVCDFYLYGDTLILLGNYYDADSYSQSKATAYVYDVSDKESIRALDSFSQSGYYVDSRMIDGTLYLVSNQFFNDENDVPVTYSGRLATPDSAVSQQVPVDCVYSVECPAYSGFLLVSSMDVTKGSGTAKTKAVIGSADTIYCNRDNLYITALEYSQASYDILRDEDFEAGNLVADLALSYSPFYYIPDETQIVKLSLEKDIEFAAYGRIKGEVNNQYALDEYEGNLRVAATTYENGDMTDTVNHLFVLDKDLKQLGEVSGFAPGESIKAVRYINETAYVITYEQTDPLFVIDLKNPSQPAILGEVKIDGFSTVLVPVDDNTLLGIGYSTSSYTDVYGEEEEDEFTSDMQVTDGLKLVLFDVTDKANPKVLDEKVFKEYDSEVQYNPRALVVNNERGDYTVPYTWYNYSEAAYENYSIDWNHAGLLNFRVDNGKLTVVDDYASKKFDWDARCVYVGDNQYLIGSYSKVVGEPDVINPAEDTFKIIQDIECVPYTNLH